MKPTLRAPEANWDLRQANVEPTANVARHECLGVWINLIEATEILDIYDAVIPRRRRFLVGGVNLHMVYSNQNHQAVRDYFAQSDIMCVDGMPIIWWLKLLGKPARAAHRATVVDWLPSMFERARDRGWRVYYLGNRPGVTARVADRFRDKFPGLKIEAGHGFFDHEPHSTENLRVVDTINHFRPDVLLVGMGTPLQEAWILNNVGRLNATVIHRCGAAADYFAGVIPMPPRTLGWLGLEGVYRLICEPRRLWRRYLVEPLLLLDLALNDFRRVYGRR